MLICVSNSLFNDRDRSFVIDHFVIDHFFTIQILALIFNSSCFINWIFEQRGKKVLKRMARDHPVRVSIFFFFYSRQFSPFILFHHWHNAAGIRSGIITHGVCLTPRKVIAHDLRRGEVHISWSPCFSGSVAKSSSSRLVVSFFLSFLFFFLSFYVPLSSSSTTVFSPRHALLMRFRASCVCVCMLCVCVEGHRHAGFSNTVISGSTSFAFYSTVRHHRNHNVTRSIFLI